MSATRRWACGAIPWRSRWGRERSTHQNAHKSPETTHHLPGSDPIREYNKQHPTLSSNFSLSFRQGNNQNNKQLSNTMKTNATPLQDPLDPLPVRLYCSLNAQSNSYKQRIGTSSRALRLLLALLCIGLLSCVRLSAKCEYSWTEVVSNNYFEEHTCHSSGSYGQSADCPWPCGVTYNCYVYFPNTCDYWGVICHTVIIHLDSDGDPEGEVCDPVNDTICETPTFWTSTDDPEITCLYS